MGNTGRIVKSPNTGNYTTIPNDICQCDEMTLEEKGLLAYLLSLPSDWVVYRQNLYNQLPDARNKVDKTFRSLQQKGYIRSIRVHDQSNGKFMGWDHIVHDQPENSPKCQISDIGEIRNRRNPKSELSEIGETASIQINTYNKETYSTNKHSTARFQKPDLNEVTDHFTTKGHPQEAERFFNYYEANGWKVGRNPMKNWKAAAANWIKNQERYGTNKASAAKINRNDYRAAAAQYDFSAFGDTPAGEIFGIVGGG